MKFSLFLLLPAALALAGCSKSDQASLPSVPGLSSPIWLQPDSTTIWLSDYVNAEDITEVLLEGKTYQPDSGRITVRGNVSAPVVNLRIRTRTAVCDVPVYACEKILHTFIFTDSAGTASQVKLAGSMNGWNPEASVLSGSGNTWRISMWLNPGRYEYQVVVDGRWMTDPNHSLVKDNGNGGLNSLFTVGDTAGNLSVIRLHRVSGDSVFVEASDTAVRVLAYVDSRQVATFRLGNQICVLPAEAAAGEGRHHLRLFAHDGRRRSNDLLIPLDGSRVVTDPAELNRTDMQKSVMYFMMVDRFFDGDVANNRPTADPRIDPKANNLGGDLTGIRLKISQGYFDSLGVNTLWLSPVSRNVEGAWGLWKDKACLEAGGKDCFESSFSAYHGYWPLAMREVDKRFGTGAELKGLIAQAHEQQMNVLLDYVAHHVHEQHPLYQQHPEWATALHLPDGRLNTELWDEQRLTTWFDVFLPTWDFANPDVTAALSDTAMYWVNEYEIDGFRHDATKHIPVEFWRALTAKIKVAEVRNERPVFQIGETYGNPELIASYLSSGQMDAQFDFNLYDAAVDAFARPESGFENLGMTLKNSLHYYGCNHLMGNITGNQDRGRFASYADGSLRFDEDAKKAGWLREINNNGSAGFERMQQLAAFIMTVPGIPCIYYGDEIAMPGGNDPDNRRMMVFEGLDSLQRSTKSSFAALAKLRTAHMALLYGNTRVVLADRHILAIERSYLDKTAIAVFYKGNAPMNINVPLSPGLQTQGLTSLSENLRWQCANGMLDVQMQGTGYAFFTN